MALNLNPTRITSKSATLIDNLFVNDLSCSSNGGNITHTISDHFLQFAQLDIFDNSNDNKNTTKYARNWRMFNQNEFKDELSKTNWNDIYDPRKNTNTKFASFYEKFEKLLDQMAPIQKLTKKEVGLSTRPWITFGILASMKKKDQLYKDFTLEKSSVKKDEIFASYKKHRNEIINLIRISKNKYFTNYFEENRTNVKKTWDGIRNLINVNKKSKTKINKLLVNGSVTEDGLGIANTMNNYFVNIGSSVDAKTTFHSYMGEKNGTNFHVLDITQTDILEIIKNMHRGKSAGPFSVPIHILKDYGDLIVILCITLLISP